jgi:hypothetical protein
LQLTFSGAIIEVCMRKLVFYPEVVGFLEEDKDDFPYVETRYSYGSPPKLIMLDNKGEQKETIRQVLLNSRVNLQLSDLHSYTCITANSIRTAWLNLFHILS